MVIFRPGLSVISLVEVIYTQKIGKLMNFYEKVHLNEPMIIYLYIFDTQSLKCVPRRYFFCGSFMFLFCLVFAMFCARLFICALWSPAGKGLTSWLSFVVSSVSLSLSHWYPGSGVVLDCIDS